MCAIVDIRHTQKEKNFTQLLFTCSLIQIVHSLFAHFIDIVSCGFLVVVVVVVVGQPFCARLYIHDDVKECSVWKNEEANHQNSISCCCARCFTRSFVRRLRRIYRNEVKIIYCIENVCVCVCVCSKSSSKIIILLI